LNRVDELADLEGLSKHWTVGAVVLAPCGDDDDRYACDPRIAPLFVEEPESSRFGIVRSRRIRAGRWWPSARRIFSASRPSIAVSAV
jgi:hypothetical protein